MQRFMFQICLTLALIFTGICSTNTALAGKSAEGGGKKGQHHKQEKMSGNHKDNRNSDHGKSYEKNKHSPQRGGHFSEQKQMFIHNYYSGQFRKGHCPPGLAKKGNRCIPPGHAKKWSKGRRLPTEVVFYELPPTILVQLGPPPPLHRFVRVAQDILLIAVGTGMVVDAFEDIGRQID
ncbi:MAG: RcnB family protein [Proteobacteria bacterium]|nr:RcnB family protein [Desulfobacula sp.]MBU3951414.1 RcnB family protein [Pseudomonadota bacterium]MBU4132413.1 RcnB family protein [Pseudomonadota bacterium]